MIRNLIESFHSLARDDKSHIRTWRAVRVTIISYTYVAGRVRVTINPVYVRCGQSARDDINDVIHTQLLYIIDRSVIIVIIIVIIKIIESEVTGVSSTS